MIERDYIMRVLQEFFEAIAKVVHQDMNGTDTAQMQERFNDMYEQFFRTSAQYFYGAEKEIILDRLNLEGQSECDFFAKVQMLSELLYRDGLIKKCIPERCMLLEKALYLLEYMDYNSRTFSWERRLKMNDIKKILTEFEY